MLRTITAKLPKCHFKSYNVGIASSCINRNYSQYDRHSENDFETSKTSALTAAGLGLAAAAGFWLYMQNEHPKVLALEKSQDQSIEDYGNFIEGLPIYTIEDVAKHADEKNGIWVSYRNGVYDITPFISQHPGGKKILLGAGASVEPFWTLFAVHKKPEILSLLEEYRIGNLAKGQEKLAIMDMENPYANEPLRHPVLKVRSQTPFNAEPPPELLVENYITPTEVFYVRNHLPVPDISEEDYSLEVVGSDDSKSFQLSLNDLKTKFSKHSLAASLQCAGNRRAEMNEVKSVRGLQWTQGAMGNAIWSGVRLRDVLLEAGFKDTDNMEDLNIQFEGKDLDPTSAPYGASIPLAKAMDPRGDVLLAYEMNGEPLSRDHGYPVRVVIPGTVGARWVKWLTRIEVSLEESESHWQKNDYKSFSPSADWDKIDFAKAPAIQELPVTSVICTPQNEETATLKDGKLNLKGYAWSGGGRRIIRVDVSVDNGKTWHVAHLMDPQNHSLNRQWSWTRWELNAPVEKGEVDVWVRAVDSSYNVQPETMADIWNLRGLMASGYHKIKVAVRS